jgi:Flp pilus assembly protein TadG
MTRHFSHRVFTRLSDCKGANLIEAALILPMLLLLSISIADFGTLFYLHLALENGVSQATRYAVTGQLMDDPLNPGTKLSRVDSIKLAMRQATPTLTISDSAFTFTHQSPGAGTWLAGTGGPGDIGKVEIGYTWKFLNPLLWPFFTNGQIILAADSAMKNESKFQ